MYSDHSSLINIPALILESHVEFAVDLNVAVAVACEVEELFAIANDLLEISRRGWT